MTYWSRSPSTASMAFLVLGGRGDDVGDRAEDAAVARLRLPRGSRNPHAAAVALVVADDLEEAVEARALVGGSSRIVMSQASFSG